MNKPRFTAFAAFCLLIAVLSSGACIAPLRSSTERAYDQAKRDYGLGKYNKAEEEFNALINQNRPAVPDDILSQAYLHKGKCLTQQKRYTLARYDFEEARDIAARIDPADSLGQLFLIECSTSIGDTYIHEGSFRVADKIFTDMLAETPPAECRDALLFRRYICALKLGQPDPDQHLRMISDMGHFDAAKLRREFKITATPTSPQRNDRKPLYALGYAGPIQVVPRSEWRASPNKSNIDPMTMIRRITVHHTADTWETMDYGATARQIRSYQELHQDPPRNWADVGYHFFIDRYGRIWEGRRLAYQGAHAGNALLNRGNIGISVMGNFEIQRLNHFQKESLTNLLSSLCHRYRLSPTAIVTHLELKNTACPGKNLQGFIDQLRAGTLP